MINFLFNVPKSELRLEILQLKFYRGEVWGRRMGITRVVTSG